MSDTGDLFEEVMVSDLREDDVPAREKRVVKRTGARRKAVLADVEETRELERRHAGSEAVREAQIYARATSHSDWQDDEHELIGVADDAPEEGLDVALTVAEAVLEEFDESAYAARTAAPDIARSVEQVSRSPRETIAEPVRTPARARISSHEEVHYEPVVENVPAEPVVSKAREVVRAIEEDVLLLREEAAAVEALVAEHDRQLAEAKEREAERVLRAREAEEAAAANEQAVASETFYYGNDANHSAYENGGEYSGGQDADGEATYAAEETPVAAEPSRAIRQAEAEMLPANHVEVLLAEHQQWLATDGESGKRATLRHADLRGWTLAGVNLANASLRGSDLAGVDLTHADLQGADLAECNFQRAKLHYTNFAGANMARVNLEYADCQGADMTGVTLNGAMIDGAKLRNARLQGAMLREARMHGTILIGAQLTDSVFRSASMAGVMLEDADLSGADMRDADLTHANFTNANLTDTNLRGAVLEGVDFSAADFSRAAEVPGQYQAQSYYHERQRINETLTYINQHRNELAVRERYIHNEKMALEQRKKQLAALDERERELIASVRKQSRWFKTGSVVWFLLAAGMATLTISQVSQIDPAKLKFTNVMMVFAGVIFVLFLFANSLFKSIMALRSMQKLVTLREGKVKAIELLMQETAMTRNGGVQAQPSPLPQSPAANQANKQEQAATADQGASGKLNGAQKPAAMKPLRGSMEAHALMQAAKAKKERRWRRNKRVKIVSIQDPPPPVQG